MLKVVPLPGSVSTVMAPARFTHDRVDPGKAVARPARTVLRREGELGDPLLNLGRHACARVRHLDLDEIAQRLERVARPGTRHAQQVVLNRSCD